MKYIKAEVYYNDKSSSWRAKLPLKYSKELFGKGQLVVINPTLRPKIKVKLVRGKSHEPR